MQPTGLGSYIIRFFTLTAKLAIVWVLFFSIHAVAQDSPGRFEAGANFTALRLGSGGFFGPGVDGDLNFGRHIALDGIYSWLPSTPLHVMTGLFGAKVGTRTEHFGFFGKVRPGFISFGNVERSATEIVGPGPTVSLSQRFSRQTERALDFGGVVEYYPARHWALRWDVGDLVVFQEPSPILTIIIDGVPSTRTFSGFPPGTLNSFHFNTGIHYRF
jgi:hypothetical protein